MRSSSPAAARRSRTAAVDATAAAAVDLARAAAEQISSPEHVGEHLGLVSEGDRIVTHYFACLDPAYRGWRWAVSVVRASRAKHVTVSESVLLPGDDAMLSPAWVPWSDRLRPGDLGPGDLLPTPPDDPRLAPGFTDTTGEVDEGLFWELGLGRRRVLSAEGRDRAATRWHSGDAGPATPLARSAPAPCATCAFFVPLAGSLRQVFGVCANEYAPDDGRVVALDHGCGAHSEAVVVAAVESAPPIVDEMGYDVVPSASLTDEEALGHS